MLSLQDQLGDSAYITPLDFNIFFQNARVAPTAPKQTELSSKHSLPAEIRFFIHVSTFPCSYPFPREFPEAKYLHRASIAIGHEAAGPAVQMRFNPSTVIGLQHHQMVDGQCQSQLVIRVPVTRCINPYLAPRTLNFHPTNACNLHSSAALPRIIVPIRSIGIVPSDAGGQVSITLIKKTRSITLRALMCPWHGTPRGQRLYFAISRWKRIIDTIYTDAIPANPFADPKGEYTNATVGTPFRYGDWYPRAALEVPPYTTIYFQNARVSMVAPRPRELPHRHLLPQVIHFYVRTMTAEVKFPLPEADYPSHKYLHEARVIPGHEAGGPAAHMTWSIDTIVGLRKHQCTPDGAPARSMQLVIVVPSAEGVNLGVEPAQLAFSPTNSVQLHLSKRLPRVIVPVYPRSSYNEMTRYVDGLKSGHRLKALKQLLGDWNTFPKQEVKMAGFLRWARVVKEIPKPRTYVPPESAYGSPYVELLRDMGEEKNRARWPRLDRAIQLATAAQKAEQQLAQDLSAQTEIEILEATVRDVLKPTVRDTYESAVRDARKPAVRDARKPAVRDTLKPAVRDALKLDVASAQAVRTSQLIRSQSEDAMRHVQRMASARRSDSPSCSARDGSPRCSSPIHSARHSPHANNAPGEPGAVIDSASASCGSAMSTAVTKQCGVAFPNLSIPSAGEFNAPLPTARGTRSPIPVACTPAEEPTMERNIPRARSAPRSLDTRGTCVSTTQRQPAGPSTPPTSWPHISTPRGAGSPRHNMASPRGSAGPRGTASPRHAGVGTRVTTSPRWSSPRHAHGQKPLAARGSAALLEGEVNPSLDRHPVLPTPEEQPSFALEGRLRMPTPLAAPLTAVLAAQSAAPHVPAEPQAHAIKAPSVCADSEALVETYDTPSLAAKFEDAASGRARALRAAGVAESYLRRL